MFPSLDKAGRKLAFDDGMCTICNASGRRIGIIPVSGNNLYLVDHPESASAVAAAEPMAVLHRRLGHLAPDSIRTLIKRIVVTGLSLVNNSSHLHCDSCEHAKLMRKAIARERGRPWLLHLGQSAFRRLGARANAQSGGVQVLRIFHR